MESSNSIGAVNNVPAVISWRTFSTGAERHAAHRHQQAVGHAEAQPAQFFGGIVEFELKVGNDADDLAAIDFKPLVLLIAEEDFADDLAEGGVVLDPAPATVVGAGEMDPEPAIAGGNGAIDVFRRDRAWPTPSVLK